MHRKQELKLLSGIMNHYLRAIKLPVLGEMSSRPQQDCEE